MKNKNFFLIFSLFMILLCCVGAISAASDDILDDTVSEIDSGEEAISEIDDEQAVAVDSSEPASADDENSEITDEAKLAASEDDSTLTMSDSDDVLSITSSYTLYSIYLDSAYTFSSYSKATIKGTISPPPTYMPEYGFKLFVFDLDNNIVCYSPPITGYDEAFSWTLPANTLLPGLYQMYAVNDYDNQIMAKSVLGVKGQAVITANDFSGKYMSGSKMTVRVTDQVSGKPLRNLIIQAVFKNGKKTVTGEYVPNTNGYISFEPPVGVGTWTVTFSSEFTGITGSAVKTAVVKKSKVTIKAYKKTEYKGFKTTLKAVVKSHGRKVNEGTVTFKINGKKYKAAVKNGVATKKVKLTKIKTYKYTAKYNGNANLAKSKTAKSKTVLKKRLKTKIIVKNYALYTTKQKKITIKVLTSNGKKVKNGKLKIVSGGQTYYAKVKNGKAKVYVNGLAVMAHFVGFKNGGETYKKSITKKNKIKYIPASHKYKSSKKTMKVTSKFRCPACGKTRTHYHYVRGYYITYRGSLIRIV